MAAPSDDPAAAAVERLDSDATSDLVVPADDDDSTARWLCWIVVEAAAAERWSPVAAPRRLAAEEDDGCVEAGAVGPSLWRQIPREREGD